MEWAKRAHGSRKAAARASTDFGVVPVGERRAAKKSRARSLDSLLHNLRARARASSSYTYTYTPPSSFLLPPFEQATARELFVSRSTQRTLAPLSLLLVQRERESQTRAPLRLRDHHTPDPSPSVKLEADAGAFLDADDDAQLEDAFFQEEDVLLLSTAEDAHHAHQQHDYTMGNAASTDQSGAASAGASGGAGSDAAGAGGATTMTTLAPPDNPGFARVQGVTAARADGQRTKPRGPPVQATQYEFLQNSLSNLLLFARLPPDAKTKVCEAMWELSVPAGEILIQEGETGLAAAELYVVAKGAFEVLERRKGVNMRVNTKERGDVFGEVSLMYSCPRTATVAATADSVVYVLERDAFRRHVRDAAKGEASQIEVFLNSVPLLKELPRQSKAKLVDAFVEEHFPSGTAIIREGDPGDKFYVVKAGEAAVTTLAGGEVNRLFRADFFGERALLTNEPRGATVTAVQDTTCLSLERGTFVEILGPLDAAMKEAKSDEASATRLALLKPRGSAAAAARPRANVVIRVRRADGSGFTTVTATGHKDEIDELLTYGVEQAVAAAAGAGAASNNNANGDLTLVEAELLGEGAFSRVSAVTDEHSRRAFALKRMAKTAALQCPEHVYCEQHISKNAANAFCIRQYASFKDAHHLYFLFDLMTGGDLMDVLVAEARIIKHPVPQRGSLRQGCLAPKVKMWQGMDEPMARFYVASIVLALEYLHDNGIIYRDLKPENVLIDAQGYAKLGDFGFAKVVELGGRTYTFCGTPGYVAPENVLGRGYNQSVDWWTLGVLAYVLLTARQPFSSPKTGDPMEVMRRIVDDRWCVKYPPYMSPAARDLIARLLERKPAKRLGMLQGRAADIKAHKWFEGFDWAALSARRLEPPRKPKETDHAKRKAELAEQHRADPVVPVMTPEEVRECEQVFKDF